MKNLALITLIVSHDELKPTQSHEPASTNELVHGLVTGDYGSYQYGVDIIDLTVTPLTLGIDKGGDDE